MSLSSYRFMGLQAYKFVSLYVHELLSRCLVKARGGVCAL